ncbi:SART3-like protein [Mya arenaria]|uniref:SART3-like protein n=1 Tax=Mya arenaria TaxID=6604 RepID=A0ABY7E2S3_MYAAR|nr:SART3-like protein [Mya arenaria]
MADKIDEAGTDKESMEINDEEDMSADDSDGDDTSDDNEEDNREEKLKIQIQEYKSQLLENPFMYDAHVNIIKTARELGDLETLRSAREKMCELFPLSEDIWLPWLQDEAGLVSDETSRENVRQLFEKAVKDYFIGGMGEADGVKKVRDTFECALTACGLHPAAGSVPSKEQERKFTEQHDRVEALFKRQISVPLQALEETLQEYEDWLQGQADKVVKQTFNKALIKLEKIRPYEKKLAAVSPPRLEEYQEYISYEEKEGDPARIQCLYERAIQENCLNTHLWLQYTKYLDSRLDGVFEAALLSGFSQGSEYLLLWTTFLDYLRRRIKWDQDYEEDLETFRLSIEKAVEQLDGGWTLECA